MSLFSSLFKTKKVNLTPDITPQMPSQINPDMYNSLSSLSKKLQAGPGFGEGFLDKATNPAIANIDANFQNRTMPTISNEASKRGLSRSSIVSDQIGQADLQRNRDINDLISKFYTLNEQQKKADTQFGANLGQNILTGDVSAQQNQANASERLANATAADARTRESLDSEKSGTILQALGSLVGGPMGGAFGSFGGRGDVGSASKATLDDLIKAIRETGGKSGVQTNILGS